VGAFSPAAGRGVFRQLGCAVTGVVAAAAEVAAGLLHQRLCTAAVCFVTLS
jgi:hypothetical protein